MNFDGIKLKKIRFVFKYAPNASHWYSDKRDYNIIGVQLSGSSTHYSEKYGKYNFYKNSIYFINQDDSYSVTVAENPLVDFSIHFVTYDTIDTKSFGIQLTDASEIINLIEKIQLQWQLNDKKTTYLAESYFYKLCDRFAEIYNKEYHQSDPRLIEAKNYIDLNFAQNDCLVHAVELCNISRRRFNTLFKQQFFLSPNRYITLKKIDYAKEFLETDFLSISEIAEICGFSDVFYFSKVFKNETGLSPAKYRGLQGKL